VAHERTFRVGYRLLDYGYVLGPGCVMVPRLLKACRWRR
jgi:hypothetical protein